MNEDKKEFKIAIILMIILILVVIAFVIIFVSKKENKSAVTENTTIEEEEKTMMADEFTTQFLKMENNEKNMIYSPLSIKYALNLLNEGASGNTKLQIENVIQNLSLTKYNNIENVLSLANSVYIKDTFKEDVKQNYINNIVEKYNSEINYDSFETADNINKWIEDKTLGIIKNMLDDEMVRNSMTKMILINALAIDMEWKEQFDYNDTYGEDFI